MVKAFPLMLNEFSGYVSEWRNRKGFETTWENVLEKLMLVITEISEAAEAYRNNSVDGFNEEIADAFIRLMDICGTFAIDIEAGIKYKMTINELRPFKHGKRA